jgi:hypothetical protein
MPCATISVMVAALWDSFPLLMEENVNGLLLTARPNALRAFQIYGTFRNKGLWKDGIERFSRSLDDFFARPTSERTKSLFDLYLTRPMEHEIFSLFDLDFRSAAVSETELTKLASWAHHLIRVSKKTTAAFASLEVITKTLHHVTNPGPNEKAKNLEFMDFCRAWRKTARRILGETEDPEFAALLTELEWLDRECRECNKPAKLAPVETAYVPGVFLTQTEIDWTKAVRSAVLQDRSAPEFPLSRGPDKQDLIALDRAALLFTKARTSTLPEIIQNRERIRATVLDRCEALLGTDQSIASQKFAS